MKKATALKTFTDSATGRRLRPGDTISGSDSRILELKAAGLVDCEKDVTDEENRLEGEALSRAAMAGAVLDEGTGARVAIGFASAEHANHFRAMFARGVSEAQSSESPRPTREPRQTKPAPARKTKPAPEPTPKAESADPGAGGEGAGPGAGEHEGAGGEGSGGQDQTSTGGEGQGGEGGDANLGQDTTTESTTTAEDPNAPPAPRRTRGNRAPAEA